MRRSFFAILLSLAWVSTGLGQQASESVPPADSLRLPPPTATMYVIPAGPVAGTFTPAARLTVEDTVAGWARIRVEGWVPVQDILPRMESAAALPLLQVAPQKSVSLRPQCAATTTKGTRCKRRAALNSRFCWQHEDVHEPR